MTCLIGVAGDPLAPEGYRVAARMVGIVAMLTLHETHRGHRLRHP